MATVSTLNMPVASAMPFIPAGVSFCQQPSTSLDLHTISEPLLPTTPRKRTTGSKIGHAPFMELPLEIRMHIYEWLHLMNPAPIVTAGSLYPMPKHTRCVLGPINDHDSSITPQNSPLSFLSPERPTSGIPTALLRTCSHIYEEARLIPFMRNEFTYVNWFSSGLWAAYATTRRLRPWQRANLRYVRLELLARDLLDTSSGGSLENWRKLCEAWSIGLRGLRLRVVSGKGPGILSLDIKSAAEEKTSEEEDRKARRVFVEEVMSPEWISDGLVRLKALRRLEIEMEVPGWSAEEKMVWCERLGKELREAGMRMVVVDCAERIMDE